MCSWPSRERLRPGTRVGEVVQKSVRVGHAAKRLAFETLPAQDLGDLVRSDPLKIVIASRDRTGKHKGVSRTECRRAIIGQIVWNHCKRLRLCFGQPPASVAA